ncbi:asparagine synthase-related protein [Paenibacillus sp. SI8]|uniref:asparagine synthase-related protein n=1 Tax=unclassified Paenibacillus TaxID=185978 RepID=UPI00346780BD
MSAIAGILNFHEGPVTTEDSGKMMRSLRRYPADDIQVWHSRSIFFGCHAQWITPESVHEQLPYYDEQNKLAITADAIIDNRSELFHRLQIEPTRQTHISDSELILKAYRKWGKETPNYLVGDFAFVIWDERAQLLFGARDLFGSRTLYFYETQQRFSFCTAIHPLFTLPNVKKELNEAWLSEYLAIPGLMDSTDVFSTVYKDVKQLPPAHSITVVDGKTTLVHYGTPLSEEKLKFKSNTDYEEALREVFQQAVDARIRTHRQVGAQLSGGLDSGSVVSFAARSLHEERRSLHTYSFIPDQDFVDWTGRTSVANESPFIQATIDHIGNISSNYLNFPNKTPLTEIDDFLEILESPYKFFENSIWVKGFYEYASQRDIGVLLTGAKGNYTISFGSAVDYYAILLQRFQWIRFHQEFKSFSRSLGIGRSRLLPKLMKHAFPFMDTSKKRSDEADIPYLIHPDLAKRTRVYERLQDYDVGFKESSVNFLNEREDYFLNLAALSLQGTCSTKLSLQHAVWERDPTCDLRVVRFCLSLPHEQFVQNGMGRSLIRRSTEFYLPDKVRLNHRTRGIQGVDWIHRMAPSWSSFIAELHKLCEDRHVSGLFNVPWIRETIAKLGNSPRPELALDLNIRSLVRSIIVYRFIQKF